MSEPLGDATGSIFTADYRVRFDEAGPDGRARTSTLLRYAQDVAWQHSEARGFDRDWYAVRGLAWVVRSVGLELLAPIGMGQRLRLTTRVIGHRRIWARRLAEAWPAEGRAGGPGPLARVITDWVILDARGRPVRIPSDFGRDFASPEVQGEIQHAAPPSGEPAPPFRVRVRPHDLDPVGHVNNAAYLDWLEEAFLANGIPGATANAAPAAEVPPRTATIEYLASAGPGDEVEVTTWRDTGSWQARMTTRAAEVLRASGAPA